MSERLPAPVLLACGHEATKGPLTSGPKKLYRCPNGCGLQTAKPVGGA